MAHAYTWVDEQQAYLRQKTHSHNSNKTEQWVLEQRVYFSHVQPQATRTRAQRQKAWEEMVHAYEVEADEWAQREAEIRRRVVRRELERARIIQEELRRTEERIKQKREAERRRIAEERAKAYLEMRELERREKQKHEKVMLEAWKSYESRWTALATSSEVLTFLTIPWPVLARPEYPGDITLEDIKAFLLWSTHSQSQARKERMRSAQLRWHPDRFRRFIKRVAEDERKEVEEGVGIVARCLNKLMAKENERARCFHTPAQTTSRPLFIRFGLALGLSAATATYLTWRLSSNQNRILLDSPTSTQIEPLSSSPSKKKLSAPPSAPIEYTSSPDPQITEHTSSSSSETGQSPTQKETSQNTEASGEPQHPTEDDAGASSSESDATGGGGGGAFNPETGEINWDCPCLGGMAHGPCGPQFREAFSCFVFSEAEPKGINCVEKFKAMQDCFREHPEVYADGMHPFSMFMLEFIPSIEIMDDDDDEPATAPDGATSTEVENKSDSVQTATTHTDQSPPITSTASTSGDSS
ncbi:hypothetical protein AMATHDRAFT_47068 [Amanita thiersii Skay4041]|uniref:Mitochondrial intermembrane space import and assembly protein 40 n=1 Tax=Amanita thiersii Skay4041 TaxID=703135 RepID=A0A2A9NKQ2_9AGAR|nr:hypothetical protein AMATHDRAFT_47068 [Amanita thiersii Skay4041]